MWEAKLESFVYMHLNMFEIVVIGAPNPAELSDASTIWVRYLRDCFTRSTAFRSVLDKHKEDGLCNPRLHEYANES
jgi:hypothetical protein